MTLTTPARRSMATACLLFMLVALSIGGCGFQPRGHSSSLAGALSPVHITGIARYSDLYRELDRQLKIAGAEIVLSAAESASILRISKVDADARLLSVNSRNKAVEYELVETTTFALRTAKGQELIAPQTVTVTRIQYWPEEAVLGSNREAELLRRDMREELAGRIVQRLAALRKTAE